MVNQQQSFPKARETDLSNPMIELLGNSANITQQIVGSASETTNRASQTVANISQTNAQTISNMASSVTALYQANAQKAAQENPWKGIAKAAIDYAGDYYDNKLKKANRDDQATEERQRLESLTEKERLASLNETEAAQANQTYNEILREFAEGKFSTSGTASFLNAVQDKLTSYKYLRADDYTRILDRSYAVANDFDSNRRKQAIEEQDKLQVAIGKKREEEWLAKTLQVTTQLSNALNTEQSGNYIAWFENNVLAGIAQDTTLTPIQRIEATAKVLTQLRENGLAKKYQSYEEYQRIQREYDEGMPKLLENLRQFAADNDLYKLDKENELLFAKYPKLRQFYKPPGTVQREQTELRELLNKNQALDEDEQKKNPLILSNSAMSGLIASAILDRNIITQLETTPGYKGNEALIRQVREGVAEYDAFNVARAEYNLELAQSNEELARLQVSTVDDVFRLQRDLAKTGSMSPEAALVIQQQSQILGITPEQIQAAQSNDANTRAQARAIIQNQINTKRQSLDQLRDARLRVLNTKRDNLDVKYPRLKALGLLGQNEAQLRSVVTKTRPVLEAEVQQRNQQIQELRLRNQQLNNQQGQQLNFQSGSQQSQSSVSPIYTGQLATAKSGGTVVSVTPLKPINGRTWFATTGQWREVRQSSRGARRHWGIDYATPPNTPIVSPMGGEVVQVSVQRGKDGRSTGYGLYVTVKQDDGFYLRYSHLNAANVNIGQRVQAGQVLGKTGGAPGHPNAGTSTGAHLHFEVNRDAGFSSGMNSNTSIDPTWYMNQLYNTNGSLRVKQPAPPRQDNQVFNQNALQSNQPLLSIGNGRVLLPNNTSVKVEAALRVDRPSAKYSDEQARFFAKNPLPRTFTDVNKPVGFRNEPEANYNYAFLANNPTFRRKLAAIADEMGTSAMFLADIISQESQFTPNLLHQGTINSVGLVGFNRSSFGNRPPANRTTEAIIQMNAVQQLDVVKEYILANTTPAQRKRIDTLWSAIRMGWNDRKRFNQTFDYNIRPSRAKTFGEELQMLGRYAGRRYAVPNQRRSSIEPYRKASFASGRDTEYSQLLANQGFNYITTTGDNES